MNSVNQVKETFTQVIQKLKSALVYFFSVSRTMGRATKSNGLLNTEYNKLGRKLYFDFKNQKLELEDPLYFESIHKIDEIYQEMGKYDSQLQNLKGSKI